MKLLKQNGKSKLSLGILYMLIILSLLAWAFSAAVNEENASDLTRAKILEILPEDYAQEQNSEGVLQIKSQYAKVKILSGKHKGEIIIAENAIVEQMSYNIFIHEGQEILIALEEDEKGEITVAYVAEIARQKYLFYLAVAFMLSLAIIGGLKGVKAVLTLILTVVAVIKVLLPLILRGYNPIIVSVGVCITMTCVTLFTINGINKKTLTAVIGTIGGVLVAGGIAFFVGSMASLTGLGDEEAQMLMYIPQQVNFDFKGILFAGIIIGALGAVMDVGMSIASSMCEVEAAKPEISTKDLIKSGMNVGRDVMGTMSNTLILAYTGGSLQLMLLFMAHDFSIMEVINWDMIASEVVRALAGSIGLIFTIPLTAMVAGTIGRERRVKRSHSEVHSEPQGKSEEC